MKDLLVVDADGHVRDYENELKRYLAPQWARRSLLFAKDAHDRDLGGQLGKRDVTVQTMLQDMDVEGIDTSILYPTNALFIGEVRERDYAAALCQAYNDWLYDRYLSKTPRVKGMAVIPAQFPEDAAAELRRAVNELGMVGGIIAAAGRVALGDPMYDPIYKAAEELDTVVAIHAGGPGNRLEMLDRAIEQRCLGHPTSLMIEMTSMMFGGVFDRFPRTRFSFMEGGIAWALFTLERMQEAYEQWGVQAPELKHAPKEHLTSGRIYFHCEAGEEILPYAVQVLGDRTLLYASDYPHIAPSKIQHHLEEFQARTDLSEESKQRILGDNARQLYKIGELAAAPA